MLHTCVSHASSGPYVASLPKDTPPVPATYTEEERELFSNLMIEDLILDVIEDFDTDFKVMTPNSIDPRYLRLLKSGYHRPDHPERKHGKV